METDEIREELAFAAYGIDHEMEHLAGREVRGEGLRVFRWGG